MELSNLQITLRDTQFYSCFKILLFLKKTTKLYLIRGATRVNEKKRKGLELV